MAEGKKYRKKGEGKISLGSIGGEGEGSPFPDATRVTLSKLEGEIIEILEVQEMQGDDSDYYICLARWERTGEEVCFGTSKVTTKQIRKFIDEGGEFPQTVAVLARKSQKGVKYFVFAEPEELGA